MDLPPIKKQSATSVKPGQPIINAAAAAAAAAAGGDDDPDEDGAIPATALQVRTASDGTGATTKSTADDAMDVDIDSPDASATAAITAPSLLDRAKSLHSTSTNSSIGSRVRYNSDGEVIAEPAENSKPITARHALTAEAAAAAAAAAATMSATSDTAQPPHAGDNNKGNVQPATPAATATISATTGRSDAVTAVDAERIEQESAILKSDEVLLCCDPAALLPSGCVVKGIALGYKLLGMDCEMVVTEAGQ